MKRKQVALFLSMVMALSGTSMQTLTAMAKTTDPSVSERETLNGTFSYQTAEEGMVLLENETLADGSLSLPIATKTVALFGTGAVATVKGGRGSGAVNNRTTLSLYEALVERGYTVTSAGADASDPADYIMKYVEELNNPETTIGEYIIAGGGVGVAGAIEHELTEEQIAAAKKDCDTAIYIVARDSGENCEKSPVPGDYYLSEIEYQNLQKLAENFANVIVLMNTGSALDTNFFNGKSVYSQENGEFVKLNLPDVYAFDADQFEKERHLYFTTPDRSSGAGMVFGGDMVPVTEDEEFDIALADPATDATSISATAGYYYWDPQYGTVNTTISFPRFRSIIFNHNQDALYTLDEKTGTFEKIPGDSRYDKDTDYYMYNVFRKIEGLGSLVYVSQAGQEGGNAIVDILEGVANPSGKLTDTWAADYYDFPSSATFAHNDGLAYQEDYTDDIYVGYRYFDTFGVEPAYAFGYGKSYTTFDTVVNDVTVTEVTSDGSRTAGTVTVKATVTNTGDVAGKEVVEVYYSAPSSVLAQPAKELADYEKTGILQPGESEEVTIVFDIADLASYDTESAAYILEAGEYILRVGNSSRDFEEDPYNQLHAVWKLSVPETTPVWQLRNAFGGLTEMDGILENDGSASIYAGEDASALPAAEVVFADGYETPAVNYASEDVVVYVSDSTAEEYAQYLALDGIESVEDGAEGKTSYIGYDGREVSYNVTVKKFDGDFSKATLQDVMEGRVSMEEFVSSLTLEELSNLAEGHVNTAENAVAYSVKGAAAETDGDLIDSRYIPNMIMADGPAGIRLTQSYEDEAGQTWYQYCTAWPIGTLLAQTWNKDLIRQMGDSVGGEMLEMGVTLWLAPGINIHRNPLCGRNFEYYSEDPVVTGTTAAQIAKGLQYGYGTELTDENFRGIGVTLKHFFGNQQESFRQFTNNTITERAIREIYLKAFQMAVEEANVISIMTSYNNNNGVPAADDRDLCTALPRDEWGFDGLIMTDWGGGSSTPGINMHSGNDLVAPGNRPERLVNAVLGTALKTGSREQMEGDPFHISIGDIQKSVMHILGVAGKSSQYRDFTAKVASGEIVIADNTQLVSFEIMDELNNVVSETTVTAGASIQYPAVTNPAGMEVTYTSSDESVATVDAVTGEVKAIAAGTAQITASFVAENGETVSGSYTLNVQ